MKDDLFALATNITNIASLMEANAISPNRTIFKLRQAAQDLMKMYYTLHNQQIREEREKKNEIC